MKVPGLTIFALLGTSLQALGAPPAPNTPPDLEPLLAEAVAYWRSSAALPLETDLARITAEDARIAPWLPSVSANASSSLNNSARWADGKNLDRESSPNPGVNVGMGVSWNLYNGHRDLRTLQMSQTQVELKAEEQRGAEAQWQGQLLAEILSLAQTEEQLSRVQREQELWQELRSGIHAKVKSGLLPRTALTEIDIQISEQEARRISLTQKLDFGIAGCNRRFGLRQRALSIGSLGMVRRALAPELMRGESLLRDADFPAAARQAHPSLRTAGLRTMLLEWERKNSDPRSFSPSVDFSLSTGIAPEVHWKKPPVPNYDYATNWSVSLGVRIPLFSGQDWHFREATARRQGILTRNLMGELDRRSDAALSAVERHRQLQTEHVQKMDLVKARQAALKEREAFLDAGLSAVDEIIRSRQALQRAELDLLSNQHELESLVLRAALLSSHGVEVDR